jgi:hypothetical protein
MTSWYGVTAFLCHLQMLRGGDLPAEKDRNSTICTYNPSAVNAQAQPPYFEDLSFSVTMF